MQQIEFKVVGMTCRHCIKAVEMEISKLPLNSFKVEVGSVTAEFDATQVQAAQIENAIREAGYQIAEMK